MLTSPRLVIEPARPWPFLAFAAACCLLAALLAPFDQALSAWAMHWQGPLRPLVDDLVAIAHLLGKGEVALLIAAACGALGRRRAAMQLVLALIALAVAVTAVKHGVGRLRPNHASGFAFPSGDAATAAAVCAVMWGGRMKRLWWLLPAFATAYGRCHDGYHYPSDVAAGVAVGALAAAAARWAWARIAWTVSARWHLAALACLGVAAPLAAWLHGKPARDLGRASLLAGCAVGVAVAARWWRAWAGRATTPGRLDAPRTTPAWPIALAAVALLAWLATTSTLWDRDEPRYALASLEMLHSHDWLVPTFNGEWRLHKPAGIYWLMSLAMAVAGPHGWAARLPAALGAGIIVALTALMARRMGGARAGPLAALVIATSPLLLVCGGGATTDAALVACMTATLVAAAAAIPLEMGEGAALLTPRLALLTGLAMGGALLIKGPVGALPVLTLAATALFAGPVLRTGWRFWLMVGLAVAVSLALFAAWGLPANAATGGEFLRTGFGKHVIERGAEPMEGHRGGPWYYIPVVLLAFWPWIALAPLALRALARGPRLHRALLLGWTVPTFLFFSLYATKLPHYILPIFPALAIAVAVGLTRRDLQEEPPDARDRLLRAIGRWLLCAPAVALVIALIAAPWAVLIPVGALSRHAEQGLTLLRQLPDLMMPLAALAAVIAVTAVLGARALARGRATEAAGALAVGMVGLAVAGGLLVMPELERIKPSSAVAAEVRARTGAEAKVWVEGYDEPSLFFALDRGRVEVLDPKAIPGWSHAHGAGVLILPAEDCAAARAAGATFEPLGGPVSGLDVANGQWYTLVAVARPGTVRP